MKRKRSTHSDLADLLDALALKLALVPPNYCVSDASSLKLLTDEARILYEQDLRIDAQHRRGNHRPRGPAPCARSHAAARNATARGIDAGLKGLRQMAAQQQENLPMFRQVGIPQAIARANSHIRYWRYRRSIGNPFPLRTAVAQWLRRFAFEAFGIGQGG
jgi:hypothetical protein